MTNDTTSIFPRRQESSRVPNKRPSRSFWIKTLEEFSKSGLSAQQFCRLKNLSPSNFYTWRKRLREEKIDESLAPSTFIPLEVMTVEPSKESFQNQQPTFLPDVEKENTHSGLSLHLNESLKIRIDKDFHGPTLQHLVEMFSLGSIPKY